MWGDVEANESAASAALRETMEEGGIEAAIEALIRVQELPPPQDGSTAIVHLCKHLSGTPTPQDRETDTARYFGAAGLASFLFNGLRGIGAIAKVRCDHHVPML